MKSVLQITRLLNNGVKIPMMGLGTWQMSDEEATVAVRQALELGYRLIDTAAFYNCEKGVGQGIRDSGISREKIFVTTKVWATDLYENRVEEAYEESLQRLGLDYVDLLILHWPVNYINGWKIMERIYRQGRVRAIGISNFRIKQLLKLFDALEVVPAVIQLELNPLVTNFEIRSFCEAKGIAVTAWQSLGSGSTGEVLNNEVIVGLAKKYGKTPAQIALRWAFQNNIITIPKTVTPKRMMENADILDFELTEEDMEWIGNIKQLPRYDTEIRDVPIRITEMVKRGVRFVEKGYKGNLTRDFYD
ncbi:MAG: aldo/keto reductase [Peptococcaceae bacterium]|jgi:diketogulonate reductase-like aldo/keto reductase|nr:aldo/keto reductase [Peptococcaceae bacterium]